MEKKLLFITTRLFWPTDSGKKNCLYHYCRGLHERYGYEIYLYSFLEDGQTEALAAQKPDFIHTVRIAKRITAANKLAQLLGHSVLCGKSFQSALFYTGKNKRAIKKFAKEVQPDVVFVDMVRLARYRKAVKRLPAKKILAMDELLSMRYRRQLLCETGGANVMGKFAQTVPGVFGKLMHSAAVKKYVLRHESKKIAKEEIAFAKRFDAVTFVSEKETEEMNKRLPAAKAKTVRLGVDFQKLSTASAEEKLPRSLGFLGNMNYAPNADTVRYIISEILPRLKQDYVFYVIGPYPEGFSELCNASENVKFLGRVEDIPQTLGRCRILLAPIVYGSGIKTKVLESMAMGLPVVTNSVGAEGIDGRDGVHFLCSDDAETIAQNADKLLADPALCEEIGKNAQHLIAEQYTWDKIFASFGEMGL